MRALELPFLALLSLTTSSGCRALLEADELGVVGGDGGGRSGSESTGDVTSGSEAGSGAGSASSATSTTTTSGPGGGSTSSGSTSTSSTATSTSSPASSSSGGGSTCGDDAVQEGEQCDDGGTSPGDGCDGECQWEGTSCSDPIAISVGLGAEVTLTTTNEGGAGESGCGFPGPSRFIEVTPEQSGFLTLTIRREGTDFNTTLINGAACGQGSARCANGGTSTDLPGGEVMTTVAEAGTPQIFAVSSTGAGLAGTFQLEVRLDTGTCGDPIQVLVVNDGSYTGNGDLVDQGNQTSASCGGSGGPDVAYRLLPSGPQTTDLDIILNSGFDGVVYVSTACGGGSTLACENDVTGSGTERIEAFDLDLERILIVDSVGSIGGEYGIVMAEDG